MKKGGQLYLVKHIDDIAIATGTALVFYGLWQIYSPLSFIFVGAVLLFIGLAFAGKGKSGEE